ncbi:hypothetical protein FRACYDRAFT_251462 [Fragilariopsis cylindrus CCMP1102]|uniref:ADP-ribosylation factor-like protein 6-interacting protein 4 n=1 Tax=Fragilariopsis cylindrus CCMP1102 TaxID=635003 RepID=A0A1E7EMJ7_9STRA|nr:hypothetical protein FRACYDRAFT_251462 [Fragilariopsis cylindrus CCMP1102]|eukprot:OEU07172.1 hypothetical protein FRACYDRAFT_251462 [Fragilariopsis cylindrus CCMP1102]
MEDENEKEKGKCNNTNVAAVKQKGKSNDDYVDDKNQMIQKDDYHHHTHSDGGNDSDDDRRLPSSSSSLVAAVESSQPTNPIISSIDKKIGKDIVTTTATKVTKTTTETTDKKPKKSMMIPMSKAQYDIQQSQIREVYDPLSGRTRLIRGSGEVIERIVSNQMHRQINTMSTSGDGYAYTKSIFDKINK